MRSVSASLATMEPRPGDSCKLIHPSIHPSIPLIQNQNYETTKPISFQYPLHLLLLSNNLFLSFVLSFSPIDGACPCGVVRSFNFFSSDDNPDIHTNAYISTPTY